MFRGHAPFVHLGDIHQLAVAELGFQGSMGEAAELLLISGDGAAKVTHVGGTA